MSISRLLPGEIRAVIGPNGAGKTTFVGLVSGRIQPSSGTIVFDGDDITGLPAYLRVRLGIAYTFQITSVFANLTAYDNVALPVQRTLTRWPLDGRARIRPASWRRSSAPALPTAPHMLAGQLVLWPPAAARGGDGPGAEAAPADPRRADARACPTARSTISSRWCARSPGSATVLLIEHNMPVVMQLADRITVLQRRHASSPKARRRRSATTPRCSDAYLGTRLSDG